jgi:hypothetical protein
MRETHSLAVAIALIFSMQPISGFPRASAARPAEPQKRQAVVYDVGDLIYKPGGRSGLDSVEDVINVILTTVDPEDWSADGQDGSAIYEVNGQKLEIHATAAQHAVIKDLVEALRRKMDLAVVMEAKLYEMDRDVFEKIVQPRLEEKDAKGETPKAVPVDAEFAEKLADNATLVQSGQAMIGDGREGVFFSRRRAFTINSDSTAKSPRARLYGTVVRASVTVSKDR